MRNAAMRNAAMAASRTLGVFLLAACLTPGSYGQSLPAQQPTTRLAATRFSVAGPAQAEAPSTSKRATKNVIFVMLDGIRWQELFTGADEALLSKERGGVANLAAMKKRFWRNSPEERRQALFPFLWGTVAKQGQLFGNPALQSAGNVSNNFHFSYPGYSEILCGFADARINSNAKTPNRNVTVLEWLHRKPDFQGKIAAFTSWDVFPYIINAQRSGIPVNAGNAPLTGLPDSPELTLLNRLIVESPLEGEDVRPDALTYHAARIYLKAKRPRLLFISFDETDSNAHRGRYDRVLDSAYKADGYLRDLWDTIQQMPQYRDVTTLIVSTDHGRGKAPFEWKNHSQKIAGSDSWWAAILGPDTPPLGERENSPACQDQIAATIASLLGFDYSAPKAGQPLPVFNMKSK